MHRKRLIRTVTMFEKFTCRYVILNYIITYIKIIYLNEHFSNTCYDLVVNFIIFCYNFETLYVRQQHKIFNI